jgi:hypothetical protein
LAWRLLDGELQVGDYWECSYDDGYATARFSVHEAVPAEEVDAFQAGDVPVLPVRWELLRPPVGEPRPMSAAAQAAAVETYDGLVARLDRAATPPEGWALPTRPSWGPEQRFGPRTPLVLARAAQVWQAGGEGLIDILDRSMLLSERRPVGYVVSVARGAAREPGRSAAVERLEADVARLVAGLGDTWGRQDCDVLRRWMLEGMDSPPEAERAWRFARDLLAEAVVTFLVAEATADLVPDRVVTWGQGGVRTALESSGLAPDERWLCSEAVDRAVSDLLASTPVEDLVHAALAWDGSRHDEDIWEILAAQFTGACYSRPIWELMDGVALTQARLRLAVAGVSPAALQQWTHALATVLCERARLHPSSVEAFLTRSRQVPGLAALVNSPLVAA